MRHIDALSAEAYLRDTGRVAANEPLRIRELTGGVSNMVLLVERPARPGQSFVLKQARAQLRTREAWHADVERVWREADVLRVCQRLLAGAGQPDARSARTPAILFEDRANYLFAMTAAPAPHVVWKAELLAGRADPAIATACGQLLATLHANSWRNPAIAAQLGDTTLFDQLRVDPYYRALARARPEASSWLAELIASMPGHPLALVHADFSPKNLLVYREGLLMVDFETGHFGDPAFDLGFFTSHLLLKACLHAPNHADDLDLSRGFAEAYNHVMSRAVPAGELADLWRRGVLHFAGCAWARLDGKSPVEYLSDERRRAAMRALCRRVFSGGLDDWPAVIRLAAQQFDSLTA